MGVKGLFGALLDGLDKDGASDRFSHPLMQSPYVYSAIDTIATAVSSVPVKLVRNEAFNASSFRRNFNAVQYNTREGAKWKGAKLAEHIKSIGENESFTKKHGKAFVKGLEEILEHPILDLLDEPNPHLTSSQLFDHTTRRLLHDGQVFWILEKLGSNEIKEIWVKPKWQFEPNVIKGMLRSWQRTRSAGTNDFDGGQSKEEDNRFELDEIVRFYKMHPFDELDGLSPLTSARSQLVQSFLADLFNESFFKNGAEPGLILTTDEELDTEKKDEMLQRLKARHQGAASAKKPMILDGGLGIAEQTSHRDMEFTDQQKWTFLIVLAIFGIPKAMIGGQEDEVNRATFEAAKTAFFQMTIIPLLIYYSEMFYNKVLKQIDPSLFLVFDLARVEGLRGTVAEVAKAAKDLLGSGFSRNEVNDRFEMDFASAEWGGSAYGNSALRTFLKLEEAGVENGSSSQTPQAVDQAEVTNPNGNSISAMRKNLQKQAIHVNVKGFNVNNFNADFSQPHEQEMLDRLQKFYKKLRKEQLSLVDNPREKNLSAQDVERVLFAKQEWESKIARIARETGVETAKSAFSSLQFELGGIFAFSLADDEILEIIESSVDRVKGSLRRVRHKLKGEFLTAILDNETIDEIKQRFVKVLDLEILVALRIARTEVSQVLSQTRFRAFQVEGVKKKIWVTAGDETVRHDHVSFGRLPKQDMNFNFMTSVGKGGILRMPSDAAGPAEQVINCRCVLIAGEENA